MVGHLGKDSHSSGVESRYQILNIYSIVFHMSYTGINITSASAAQQQRIIHISVCAALCFSWKWFCQFAHAQEHDDCREWMGTWAHIAQHCALADHDESVILLEWLYIRNTSLIINVEYKLRACIMFMFIWLFTQAPAKQNYRKFFGLELVS